MKMIPTSIVEKSEIPHYTKAILKNPPTPYLDNQISQKTQTCSYWTINNKIHKISLINFY